MLIFQLCVGKNWEQAWMLGLRIRFHIASTLVLVKVKMQVVWVTGASTGIGAALAMEAVKNGAKVAITARSLAQNGFSDFKKKYFRRGELLDKVKDQCIAKGGSASQVE